MIVVDGTDIIFGRMATQVAKHALKGEEIHIINSEKLILNGKPLVTINKFLERKRAKNKTDPEKSPKWPKVPHMLVKRMIRGMLPWKTKKGKEAYRRIMVYTGNPKEMKATDFKSKKHDGISPHITVHYLCRMMGYQG